MIGDLLQGAGANLVGIEPMVNDEVRVPEKNPLAIAENACQAYLSDGPGKVVGSGPDGLDGDLVPGYYVFIDTGKGLCCATPRGTRRSGASPRSATRSPRQSGRLSSLV